MAAALRIAGRRLIGAQRLQSKVVYKSVVSPLIDKERRQLLPSLVPGGRQYGILPLRSMSSTSSGGADAYTPKFNQVKFEPSSFTIDCLLAGLVIANLAHLACCRTKIK
jgi:hypothetical protein